jgi:hypothetical protein
MCLFNYKIIIRRISEIKRSVIIYRLILIVFLFVILQNKKLKKNKIKGEEEFVEKLMK